MAKRKIGLPTQLILGGLLIITAGFLAYFLFATAVSSPLASSRTEAIAIAKDKTKLKTVETFNIVTTDETYYSLTGTAASGENVGVILPKNGGAITVVSLADGQPAQDFSQKGAATVDLALYKGKVVWESNTTTDFNIYDFKTGAKLK